MKKIASALTIFALALIALVHLDSRASAAGSGPTATLTLRDNTPTRTETWGTVVHYDTITVARGTTVKIQLAAPVLPGYKWEVTAVQFSADCNGNPDQPTGNDFRCFEDSPAAPVLSASGTQYEDTFTAPSVPTTIRVDYAYFPPMKPGQTSNTAIKVFEANVVVK